MHAIRATLTAGGIGNISRRFDVSILSAAGKRRYTWDSRTDGVSSVYDAERRIRGGLLDPGEHVVTIDVQVLRDGCIVQGIYRAQFEARVPERGDPERLAA